MAKLKGRDVNGMRAANWSPPDLSGIKGVKVSAKCGNDELLNAVKTIVSDSVRILRGNAADDRYRSIVDLIMMRVRGALAFAVDQIKAATSDFDQDTIISDVKDGVVKFLEEKYDQGTSDWQD